LIKPRGNFDSPVPPSDNQMKNFVMEDVLLTQSKNGRDEFVVKAARVNSGIHDDVLELAEIEAQLVDSEGRSTLLTGGEAFYHNGQQIFTIIDNVWLQTSDGREMKTEALRYLTKFRKIKTAEDVWLDDDEVQVTGGNLFYDLNNGRFRVGGGVKVDLY